MTFFVIHEILWVQFLTGLSTLESAQFCIFKFKRSLLFIIELGTYMSLFLLVVRLSLKVRDFQKKIGII